MAKDSGMGSILTLGAVAVGGYFLYEWLMGSGLPADAVYVSAVQSGSGSLPAGTVSGVANTAAISFTGPGYLYYGPSEAQFYFSTTAPTAAQTPAVTAASSPATSTPATPVSTTVTTGGPVAAPTPAAGSPTLAAIYSNILAGASTDPNFTGSGASLSGIPNRWMTYLNLALQGTAFTAPSTSTVFPGVDLTQPMTATTFWASMGPALTSAYGLSGFCGLGQDTVLDQGTGITYDMAGNPIYGPSDAQLGITAASTSLANQVAGILQPSTSAAPNNTTMYLAIGAVGLLGLFALVSK